MLISLRYYVRKLTLPANNRHSRYIFFLYVISASETVEVLGIFKTETLEAVKEYFQSRSILGQGVPSIKEYLEILSTVRKRGAV